MVNLFRELTKAKDFSYSQTHEKLYFNGPVSAGLQSAFEEFEIIPNQSGEKFSLEINRLPFLYYDDKQEFLEKFEPIRMDSKCFGIRDFDGKSLFVTETFELLDPNGNSTENSQLQICCSFFNLLTVFLQEGSSENEGNSLIDYYDEFNMEYVLVSNKTISRLGIPVAKTLPLDRLSTKIISGVQDLTEALGQNTRAFKIFLKDQFLKGLVHTPRDQRLVKLANRLSEYVMRAQVDYDVYMSEFSIEEVKQQYQEFRKRFYADTSDILSKVSTYVVSLPIGTLAGAYAIEKSKGSNESLLIIGAGILAAVVLMAIILRHYVRDLYSIQSTSDTDYKMLIEHTFFQLHPDEKKLFRTIHDRLGNKVTSVLNIIHGQFWVMVVFTSLLLAFAASSQTLIIVKQDAIIMLGVILLCAGAIASHFLMVRDSEGLH